MAKIYIVNEKGLGGFCLRPDKDTLIEPGIDNAFEETLMNAETKKRYMADGHIKYVDDKKAKAPAKAPAKESAPVEVPEALKEFLIYTEDDLKDLKRADLDEKVKDVYEAAGIEEVPEFGNMDEIKAFLTSEAE